jgi:hypothetical protein
MCLLKVVTVIINNVSRVCHGNALDAMVPFVNGSLRLVFVVLPVRHFVILRRCSTSSDWGSPDYCRTNCAVAHGYTDDDDNDNEPGDTTSDN